MKYHNKPAHTSVCATESNASPNRLSVEKSRDKRLSLIFVFTLIIFFSTALQAAPGDLDLTFDSDGKVVTPIDSGSNLARAIAIQPDGKIVAVGESSTHFALARFNPDGSLDASFDTDGKVVTTFPGVFSRANAVAIQADGKIVAAGGIDVFGNQDFVLVRYNADGSLDTSFDGDGIVVTSFGNLSDPAYAIAIQTDGKIIVAGDSTIVSGQSSGFALARYNTNGSLDSSFDLDGKVITTFNVDSFDSAKDVEIQADGKIIAFGDSSAMASGDFALARYNSDGSLDNTFDTDGKVTTDISGSDVGRAMEIQSDGKIVGAGYSNPFRFTLTRYNTDGSLDTNFDTDGKVMTSFGVGSVGNAVTIQSDNKIILAGYVFNANTDFALARYNTDGSLDNAFGTGGKVVTQVGSSSDAAHAIAIQTDGKIVAAGNSAIISGQSGFALVRYLAASTVRKSPYDFDGDSKTDVGIFRPSDGSWWYSRSLDNAFRVYSFGASTDVIAPGDFTGDGKADISIFRPSTGEWYIQRSEDNSFFSFPFGTSGDVPAPADYDGDGKADAAVYRPSSGTWFILNSGGSGTSIVQFGASEDKPVTADYDGDGKSDIAIFRPSDGSWWYLQSSNAQFKVYRFGVSTDKPVQGDWTGDGKVDLAVFRPSTGEWFVQRSEDNSFYSFPFGAVGDIPAPGDYDGDGRTDAAIFRPTTADWYVQRSSAGILITNFGTNGDRPIPNAFVP